MCVASIAPGFTMHSCVHVSASVNLCACVCVSESAFRLFVRSVIYGASLSAGCRGVSRCLYFPVIPEDLLSTRTIILQLFPPHFVPSPLRNRCALDFIDSEVVLHYEPVLISYKHVGVILSSWMKKCDVLNCKSTKNHMWVTKSRWW